MRIGLAPGAAGEAVRLTLNERPIASAAELRERLIRLAEADAQARIILVIDDDVYVQQAIAIWDLCEALELKTYRWERTINRAERNFFVALARRVRQH